MTNKEKHNQYVDFVTEMLLALSSGKIEEATEEEKAIYKMADTGKLNKDAMIYFAKKRMKEGRGWEIDKDYNIGNVDVKKGRVTIIPSIRQMVIADIDELRLDFEVTVE